MIAEGLLAEFDQETAVTRRLLERAPAAAFAWSPHPKSFTLSALATHLSRIPGWGERILTQSGYDMVADGNTTAPVLPSPADVLDAFDRSVATVRAVLTALSDAELNAPWQLTRHGEVIFTAPRIAAFKAFVINHLVHHRGQLSVYLRLQDVPVPPMYGPTADEPL
jgi:uncharacterized damage-inducible protein DinB